MKTRGLAGWSAASGLAIAPGRAQPPGPAPGWAEEVRRAVARVQGSEAEYSLRRRTASLELEVLQAQVEIKKGEIARADAEFRLGRIRPDLAILTQLERPIPMKFEGGVSLEDLFRHIRDNTKGPESPDGLAIYIDPRGLLEAEKTMASEVPIDLERLPLRTTLRLALKQLGLTYTVRDGLLTVTSSESADEPIEGEMPGP